MAFKPTADDLKRSQKCPAGMHIATLTEVQDEYLKENGNTVQEVDFETDKGYIVKHWFNAKMMQDIIAFVQAADNVTFTEESLPDNLDLKEYKGKKVCISVSHAKDKNNKVQAQIDDFFSADKVPF